MSQSVDNSEYILVTGGAGYIGSHTVIELVNNGYKVVIVDNLVNSSYDAVARIEFIVKQKVPFFDVDIRDYEALAKVFKSYKIKGVIHFAALKAVGESTKIPLDYYDNNVGGTINLLKVMKDNEVKTIVFSSSATVYGDATRFENMIPIPEHCPNDPTNPYGKTKYVIEQILHDVYNSDDHWRSAILRYFNPIGAHPSGLIGEDPLGIPNNLLPYLAQVAIGRREKLSIFGNDYNSHDGTPIRDYIHVVDLAKGHISALQYLNNLSSDAGLFREWNLGTGKGSTVFDVYHAFCKAVGRELPYEVVGRRAGDVLDLTANPTRANEELKWKASLSIEDACNDLWKWTTENPFGFQVKNYNWSQFSDGFDNRLHSVEINNFKVNISNYGATIQNILVDGQPVVNGFPDAASYKLSTNPFFGATVGRYANRIENGQFNLDGKTYLLPKNENGITTLHGGEVGYDKKTFLGPIAKQVDDSVTLEFLLVDEDGSNGFPATVETVIKFTISEGSLQNEFIATIADKSPADATPINLTNHTYFNLANTKTIDGTQFKLVTTKFLDSDPKTLLPNGKFKEIESSSINLLPELSYDDCFIVDEAGSGIDTRGSELKELVYASVPGSSIQLKVYSTDPAFQLYTGDGVGAEGFSPRSGFCVEPARFTNAVNRADWANQVILRKGETYGSIFKYTFTK